MSGTEPGSCRPLRADAERNRLRILDAAAELFAERGLRVSLDEVAERAGVGVGTVYRRFPSRDTLIEALFETRVAEIVSIAEQAAADPDPWCGLCHFLERGAEFHGRNRAIKELMFSREGGRHWVDEIRGRMRPAVGRMVAGAQEQGALRRDLDTRDIPLLMLTLAAAIEFTACIDSEAWHRLLAVVIDGLAADSAETPLREAPLTQAQLLQAMARSAER